MASSPPLFNLDNFESHWEALDEGSKALLIEESGFFPPEIAIVPILEGILSIHFNLRSKARKSLEILQKNILQKLKNTDDPAACLSGIQASAMVCARIYHQIRPDTPFNEMGFFLKTLLGLGDKGAYFAFKSVYQEIVSQEIVKKIVPSVGQAERLLFVDQYLQSTPADRLKFGNLFKAIVGSITHREAVIEFYARLFDRKRDADPFLNNIGFHLRNPATIMEKEIASASPAIKIMGLKALSMIQTRISPQLLMEILEGEEVKKVRIAVYSIIENSSMGLYPELFELVLDQFYQCDPSEAVNAFKALVVTGKVPVHDLFRMVRNAHPQVMPLIHIEISDLSRISFFIIQDIALNKEEYQTDNFDINLACIWGMIKKRPERVLKILKHYDEQPGNGLKMDVTGFMEKTKQLLGMEKEHIKAPFTALVARLQDIPEKPKKFFSAVFQDPIKKKLAAFKQNIPSGFIDFKGHKFENESFCGLTLTASTSIFTQAIFENCDLSNASVSSAYFKKTIFYNVTMDSTVFDSICFDNAVFINVNARQAVFKKCSFQGARLYNCNFNQAGLKDAVFINAVLSKLSFGDTDLSCASFAHARISGVSFATSHINLADFSHVRGRFSRFPSYAQSIIRTEGINYNDRHYQLGFNDLPQLDKALASEINMLIFCEFIHYGENKFLDQNTLSLLTAYDIFKPPQADLFQIIPLLIHENFQFSDADDIHPETPCGIAEYLPSNQAVTICEKYTGRKKFKVRRNFSPIVQGLYTMGSVGSLAQNFESDIDYWVCINEDVIERDALAHFSGKLNLIETLAWEKFKTRVTFFIVDILKAKNNDFGGSTQESSGSAQSRLLKEEFYRTMIHVAGKLPLWSVLPTTISLNYYNMILDHVSSFTQFHRYVDLGDIHAIPVNEYFGASIWQMFKWLKSPFKSVIKMALLEKYIHAYGKESLLCNQYKNEWMNSGTHLKLAQNDSYIILLKHLIAYYHKADDVPSANLLLTCFFLKLEISKEKEITNTIFGLRKILLEKCLSTWGWDKKRLFEIGRFREWPYASIQRLSATIEQYMQAKYIQVKKYFESQPRGGLMISSEDRKVLERKVDIVFLEKPFKIKKILLVSSGDRHFTRLHLKHIQTPGTPGGWELLHKSAKINQGREESLARANSIEEIGAWLINNNLYTRHSIVNLMPNPTIVTHDDIEKLYKAMYAYFSPYIQKPVRFNELRKEKPRIVSLFISINFYAPRQQARITDYCAVYINSWGEMYFRTSWPGKTFSLMENARADILESIGIKQFPSNTAFYFSKGMAR